MSNTTSGQNASISQNVVVPPFQGVSGTLNLSGNIISIMANNTPVIVNQPSTVVTTNVKIKPEFVKKIGSLKITCRMMPTLNFPTGKYFNGITVGVNTDTETKIEQEDYKSMSISRIEKDVTLNCNVTEETLPAASEEMLRKLGQALLEVRQLENELEETIDFFAETFTGRGELAEAVAKDEEEDEQSDEDEPP